MANESILGSRPQVESIVGEGNSSRGDVEKNSPTGQRAGSRGISPPTGRAKHRSTRVGEVLRASGMIARYT
ncbi:hypothetical protein B2J93_5991 [Marssonina coronariae]|uniref:Uncharacterized protein n=1 Tax=Diplocarpon coronariae TaxID=2795749 RepID=A0A218Z8P0_9HELO|nr:hypothetical protein B2J93_5991 [Marssonina coronariae]